MNPRKEAGMNEDTYNYKMKCRSCGKINTMYFSSRHPSNKDNFKKWLSEHSTLPIQNQCSCDYGSITFHDLVSHNAIH